MKRWIPGCLLLLLAIAAACRSAPGEKPQAASAAAAGSCSTNEQCAEGEYCSKIFAQCGESGLCETRPPDCVEHGHVIDKPVCGCDGKTYGNYCLAAASGVNVRSEGPCASGS